MKNVIQKNIDSTELDISVVIKDLIHDKWLYKHNETNIYSSASLIKIPIMVEAFYQIEQGLFDPEDSIRINPKDRIDYSLISDLSIDAYPLIDLIRLMIILSDNTATNILIDLLGFERINDRITALGCKNTSLQRKMLDFKSAKAGMDNLTNPIDMALIIQKIYNKSICTHDNCELMIDILSRQRHRDMLPRHISEKVTIAHKTGVLNGLNHDIGVFYLKKIDYLIGVFTSNAKDDLVGKQTIGRISKSVYDLLSN